MSTSFLVTYTVIVEAAVTSKITDSKESRLMMVFEETKYPVVDTTAFVEAQPEQQGYVIMLMTFVGTYL